MKYEAKGSAGAVVSTPTGGPYISLDQPTARTQCEAIGAGYHLISEPEWMTIVENIATTPINDLESTAGLQLATGHSANTPASALATTAGADPVITSCNKRLPLSDASNAYSATCQLRGAGSGGSTDADKGYYGTGQAYTGTTYTAGADNDAQLRTHVLSNGQVIWDIAGNVWEWTDAYVQGTYEKPANATSTDPWTDAWIEYTTIKNYSSLAYARPKNPSWTSANGIGQYYAGHSDGLRGFIRGGGWDDGVRSGAFTLSLNRSPANGHTSVGCRCAR
jgi:hypothetical protein